MAAPDISLGKSEVLLINSASTLGIVPLDNTVMFGTVEKVSDLCDAFSVGVAVFFNPTKARKIIYGSTIYYIIEEQNISGIEPPAV